MSLLRSMALKGLAVVVCALGGFAASAQAADGLSLDDRSGVYAVVKGGYAFVDTGEELEAGSLDLTPESAYLVAGGVGCNVRAFRFEVEGVYLWGSEEDSAGFIDAELDYNIIAPMVNVFFDIPVADRLTAYVGAGAGWAFLDAELSVDPLGDDEESEGAFAWQIMAGLGYQVADNVTLTAGYRGFDATGDVDLWAHTIELGARFDF